MVQTRRIRSQVQRRPSIIEGLESRILMDGLHLGWGALLAGGNSIRFALAPSAVQTGLNDLATTQGLTAPSATQKVTLGNTNGIESYSIVLSGSGVISRLTVDQNGNAITAPTRSTTTFDSVGNSAVTDEITAIAAALHLTAPTDSTKVNVVASSSGTTFTVNLSKSNSAWWWTPRTAITVDENGVPVGNQSLPLSVLPQVIQDGLTSNAPVGATALTSDSLIRVQTLNGVTTYTAKYITSGVRTLVTVDGSGALHNLPSTSVVEFSTIPSAAQTSLQSLVTDAGGATIADTQKVTAFDEANGTTVYTLRTRATTVGWNGRSYSYWTTFSVDQDGNPTVPPQSQPFFGFGFRHGRRMGFCWF